MAQGRVFIISAASGTGKTTLVSRLVKGQHNIRVSISHTTRPMRAGEENGVHYHFVDVTSFENMIAAGDFLEYAQVYGNYYGSALSSIKLLQNQGFDVILEIDTQGAEQVRKLLPNAISIFILPPSIAALEERLSSRATDSQEVIARRLGQARYEMSQARHFDYVVVNDTLEQAEANLLHIIKAKRLQVAESEALIHSILQA